MPERFRPCRGHDTTLALSCGRPSRRRKTTLLSRPGSRCVLGPKVLAAPVVFCHNLWRSRCGHALSQSVTAVLLSSEAPFRRCPRRAPCQLRARSFQQPPPLGSSRWRGPTQRHMPGEYARPVRLVRRQMLPQAWPRCYRPYSAGAQQQRAGGTACSDRWPKCWGRGSAHSSNPRPRHAPGGQAPAGTPANHTPAATEHGPCSRPCPPSGNRVWEPHAKAKRADAWQSHGQSPRHMWSFPDEA